MQELENATPIIVKGIKTYENEPSIRKNEYGETTAVYTLSSFKIKEVFKNNTDALITNDSEIPILENEAYDKKTDTTYHIAGYKKMKTNNEYILFLYYSASDDWYVPKGVTFGKIPVDNTEENLYLETNEISRSNEKPIEDIIADQVREKYSNQ